MKLPGFLVVLWLSAGTAVAQAPTVSPTVVRSLSAADSIPVWLFARPGQRLGEIEAQVVAAGGRVRHRSAWLNAVSANIPTAALRGELDRFTARHIQRVGVLRREPAEFRPTTATRGFRAPSSLPDFGPSEMPLRVLNALPLVGYGLTGAGVTIAMLDTGFETGLPIFAGATIVDQWDFIWNDSIVRNQSVDAVLQSRHGTGTWSLLAANQPGTMVGLAPDANYLLAKTEDTRTETRTEEDNFVAALEWAAERGADVITASLTYLDFDDGFSYTQEQLNGDVGVTTVAVDAAVALGITVVVAAGNDGPLARTVATPADADSVISVGAIDSLGTLAGFSSRGPTSDGRIKPELVAPGVDVFTVSTTAASGFARVNGTSFAAPLIAGIAALIKQSEPWLTPVEIAFALKYTGTNAASPDNDVGWGIPDARVAATFPRGITVSAPATDTLDTVTPTISWGVPAPPPFALPTTTRFIVARDIALTDIIADTVVPGKSLTIATPQPPGTLIAFQIEITTGDGLTVVRPPSQTHVVPNWARLLNLDDPSGLSIRDDRPVFAWTSPSIVAPPGPFVYNLVVRKAEDGSVALSASNITDTTFTPSEPMERNTPYQWSVEAVAGGFGSTVFSRGSFVIIDRSAPFATALFQNFPNPFPSISQGVLRTCFWFDLATAGPVTFDILDIRGHRVRNLVPSGGFPETLEAGRYGRPSSVDPSRCDPRLEWDGTTESGSALPRGVYLARLTTNGETLFRRVVFLGPNN